MNKRQRASLQFLGICQRTSSELAQLLDAPEPSIRRSIQTLRAQGWNISFAGPTGLYQLAQPPAARSQVGGHVEAFDTNIEGDRYRGPNGDEEGR